MCQCCFAPGKYNDKSHYRFVLTPSFLRLTSPNMHEVLHHMMWPFELKKRIGEIGSLADFRL